MQLKVLSHWRRRRRDWSVAATRATRETKKWLALSPRRLLGDVSRGDNQSRGRRRDVSETSSQLRGSLRHLRPYLIGLETRWRLESPLVAETSPRRLLETSRVSGESREIQTCSIFLKTSFSLQQVSETSPRPAGDVAATSPRPAGDVAATSPWFPAGLGDVAETSPRQTCWRLEKVSQKIEQVSISRDSPETRLVSRRRRGDVSATSGDSSRQLVAT